MTCDEYLSILASTPVDEVRRSQLPDHVAKCPHCQRATRMVMERERQFVGLDDDLYSQMPAVVPPAAAIAAQRHRYVNRLYRIAVGITIVGVLALLAGKWLVLRSSDVATTTPAMTEHAFLVQCLSAEEAGAIARPLLGTSGQLTYAGETGRGVVTVRGTPSQIREVTAALALAQQQGLLGCTIRAPAADLP